MQSQNQPKSPWKQFRGNVLVAEDNPANRMLIETLLQKHGLKPTLTENGKQAVEAALNGSFDMILMDMQMPVLNGYEATRLLREKGLTIPIVALTASVMVGDRQKCIEAGCDDFLSKPINRVHLQVALDNSLQRADDPVTQQVEKIAEQTDQLNKLVEEATPNVPQSILNEDQSRDSNEAGF